MGLGAYLPGRNEIDTSAMVKCSPSQRVHDTSHSPLCAWIHWTPWAIKEGSSGSDQYQASIFLLWRWLFSVLFDEKMHRELGRV